MEKVKELLSTAHKCSDSALDYVDQARKRMQSITVHQHIYSTTGGDINNVKSVELNTLLEIIEHYKDIIKAKDATIEVLKGTIENITDANLKTGEQ